MMEAYNALATSNEQRATSNEQRATSNEHIIYALGQIITCLPFARHFNTKTPFGSESIMLLLPDGVLRFGGI